MRAAYTKHNLYVQSVVPRENLLVWNLKDGWEPLCKFLNHKIPTGPIPHDNRTGDTEFIENYAFKTKFFKRCEGHLINNLAVLTIKIGLVGFVGYKQWKTNGTWLLNTAKMSQEFLTKLTFRLDK